MCSLASGFFATYCLGNHPGCYVQQQLVLFLCCILPSTVRINHDLVIPSTTDGQMDCFKFGDVMNNVLKHASSLPQRKAQPTNHTLLITHTCSHTCACTHTQIIHLHFIAFRWLGHFIIMELVFGHTFVTSRFADLLLEWLIHCISWSPLKFQFSCTVLFSIVNMLVYKLL